jgi:sialate O-acetylesterase
MIHGLTKLPIGGVIWSQGESNAGRAEEYGVLFPAMIKAWRKVWKDAKLPFYFVQLANYQPTITDPRDSQWAELRESQNKALKLPYTGTALAIDIGDTFDIHPANKQEVGRRLAALALKRLHGKKVADQGPTYKKHTIEKGGIRIQFDAVEKGLTPSGEKLLGFAVAGKDRKFYWADAKVVSKSAVMVSSAEVPQPVAVRYAWADNPHNNLRNSAGLPANPFRTDKWPGLTKGKTWPL